MKAAFACTVLAYSCLCFGSSLAAAPPPAPQAARNPRAAGAWPADVTRDQVKTAIHDCEDRSDKFRKSFAGALRESVLEGKPAEDYLNRRAKLIETALDRAKRGIDRGNFGLTKTTIRQVIPVAKEISKAVRKLRLRPETEQAWVALRTELNALARLFRLEEIL